jgi:hypothetical protein
MIKKLKLRFNIKIKEESRVELFFFLGLVVLILGMVGLSVFLRGREAKVVVEKDKTVIVTEAKKDAGAPKAPSKNLESNVREALKHNNYSTAVLELNRVSKDSPEYKEMSKIIAEENLKRKAPNVRKVAGTTSSGGMIRYLDESTPRDRLTDALYIYFVDISGTLFPHFAIQNASKRPLGVTSFIISTDKKDINIHAPYVTMENTEKGVAEIFDVPLDKPTFGTVQAIIKAKKVTLTVIGTKGKVTRDITSAEIKGINHILEGYAVLGGNLDYMGPSTAVPPSGKNIKPHS